MAERRRKMIQYSVIGILILIAYIMMLSNKMAVGNEHILKNTIRVVIHIGIIGAWMHSIRRRVVHPQIRRYLSAICVLMMFWIGIRYYKWCWNYSVSKEIYLWYCFYLPLIFIPFFSLLIARMIGKNESYHFPKWVWSFYLFAAVLFLLVLTNNVHQLVFSFPGERTSSNGQYIRGPVFYLVLTWGILCITEAIRMMIHKSRNLRFRQKLALIAAFLLLLTYVFGYLVASNDSFLHTYLQDMTTVECLMTILIFEICFYNRLILNNKGYEELFRTGYLRVAIENAEEELLLCSKDFQPVPEEILKKSKESSVLVGDSYRMQSYSVLDGYVFWQEDVSALMETIHELEEMKLELEGSNELAIKELELETRRARISELQRIYDRIQKETSEQIYQLSCLIEQYDQTDAEEEQLPLLQQMVVIGAYLKRRSNLLFLSNSEEKLASSELGLCIRESLEVLEAMGILTSLRMQLPEKILPETATVFYDFFEAVLEKAMPQLCALTVNLRMEEKGISMVINTDSKADLMELSDFFEGEAVIEKDDEEWMLSFLRCEEEGA